MASPGLEFVFESSAENALAQLGELAPEVVVVGSMVGSMEALEFLALATRQYSDFPGKIVALPDRDDNLVPMCHYKDRATGRSVTEELSLERLAEMLTKMARDHAGFIAPRLAATPSIARPPTRAPAPPVSLAAPVTPASGSSRAMASASNSGWELGPKGLPIPWIAAALVAFLGIGAAWFAVSGSEPNEPSATIAARPDHQDAPPAPNLPSAVAEDEVEPQPQDEVEPQPQDDDNGFPAVDPKTPVILPLWFPAGQSGYQITDPLELEHILKAFRAVLNADPEARVEVGGHTSRVGHVSINQVIGERRAEAVRRDLISRGIAEERVVIKSYGASKPLAAARTTKGIDRRVTIQIVN
jgi:outer membrane protein OmpA-like peptidoglycan-associated protein